MASRPLTGLVVLALLVTACTGDDDGAPADRTTPTPANTSGGVQPTVPLGVAAPPPPPPIVPVAHPIVPSSGTVSGIPIPIAADVLSAEPIESLELLVNGVVTDRVDFATPDVAPTFVFEWVPPSAGEFVAEVFATSVAGVSVGSLPGWMSVAPGDGGDIESPVNGLAGSSVRGLSLPPLDVAGAGVSIDAEGCTASIEVPAVADAGGLIVKGATPGTRRFVALDILSSGGGSVSVPMSAGPILVRADSYTTQAVTGSMAFVVPGRAECGGEWSGDLRIVDGVLVGDRVGGVDVAYLYASTDGVSWSRLPAGAETFLDRRPLGFAVTAELAAVVASGGDVEIEGWGWRGGELIELGTGSFVHREVAGSPWIHTAASLPSELTIQQIRFDPSLGGNATLELDHANLCLGGVAPGGCVDEPSLFHWKRFAVSEAGLLQISRLPFPSGAELAPVGLLYAEMIPTDESSELFIPLDLRELGGLGNRPMESAEFSYAQLDAMQADLSVLPAVQQDGVRRSAEVFRGDALTSLVGVGDRLFVRLVHFVDGRPTDATSNTVGITVDSSNIEVAPQPLGVAALEVNVGIDLPRNPNTAFEHCVRVVANPFGSDNPLPDPTKPFESAFYLGQRADARTYTADGAVARGLEPGATVCAYAPVAKEKDLLDYIADFVEIISDAWDLYVEVWDMLQQKLVEGLVFVTGCEPKDVCTAIASGMLKAGLTVLGVPPTMPKFADLVEIVKGDLAEVAAQTIVQESGLCPDALSTECEEIVANTLDWVLDEIQSQVTSAAVATARDGKYKLWIHPDIDVVSEPAGQISFGFADVAVTRPAGSVGNSYAPCTVTFEVFATGRVEWREANGTYHDEVVTERVVGPVTSVLDPNELAPGETALVGLLPFDFDRTTHLAGAAGYGLKSQYDAMEAWRHLMRQPDTMMRAVVDVCGTPHERSGPRVVPPTTPDHYPTPEPFSSS